MYLRFLTCYLQRAGILYTNAAIRLPIKDHVEVIDNIAEQCHVQYLIGACKNSEDGLDQHGVDLGKKVVGTQKKRLVKDHTTKFHSIFFVSPT